jgi:mutator protein MutT
MPTRIAIAVVEHEGRFLIGQRPAGVPLAGLWEFPGGKIEQDETPERCAVRECREETGCDVEVVSAYPSVVHQYNHSQVELCFFACRPINPSTTARPPFRWVQRSELGSYTFPAANAELLRFLINS